MMHYGQIKFIKNGPKGYFGFLMTPNGDRYFQERDRGTLFKDSDGDTVGLTDFDLNYCHCSDIEPKVGDTVAFIEGNDHNGRTKACVWCLAEDSKRLESLTRRFSLIKKRKNHTTVLWTGYDPLLMHFECDRIQLPVENNNGYVDGIWVSYSLVYEDESK